MGYPRHLLVDAETPGFYHCVSRCVRRAFLCGDAFDHRRRWIEDRLAELLDIFALEFAAYAIMANHLHLILKTDPQRARAWSDLEVARRWVRLYPKALQRATQHAATPEEAQRLAREFIANLAAQKRRIRIWRKRLASISWFNKLLKEPIARRANQEDDCTGHFWEGRFKSYRLLDDAAILACMVYVDLNPLRAGAAAGLEDSLFTSILQRMKVLRADRRRRQDGGSAGHAKAGRKRRLRLPLIPIRSLLDMTTSQYVSLVAHTGGVPIDDKDHAGRLRSLGLDPSRWQEVMTRTARRIGTAVGSVASRLEEAGRRGATRVLNALDVYAT